MLVDHSRDYLVWTNPETVNYRSVRNTGSVSFPLVNVLRRELSRQEKAESRGAYAGGEVNLLVPSAVIPASAQSPNATAPLKPGDTWTDRLKQTFTVLQVREQVRNPLGVVQLWNLRSLNLVIAYDLRDLVTIQTPNNLGQQDTAAAQGQKTWVAKYPNIQCRLQPQTSQTVDQRGIRGFMTRYLCYVQPAVSVTMEDRVTFKGLFYDIVGFTSAERLDELNTIELEYRP